MPLLQRGERRAKERRRGELSYDVLKVLVTLAAVVVLGIALRESFVRNIDAEIRWALIAAIAALGGYPGMESVRALIRRGR